MFSRKTQFIPFSILIVRTEYKEQNMLIQEEFQYYDNFLHLFET